MHRKSCAFATIAVATLLSTFTLSASAAVISYSGSTVKGSSLSHSSGFAPTSPLVYAQDTDYNGGYVSQNDTTGGFGNFATAYDNFTLGTTSTIDEVAWTGSYFDPNTRGTITGFTLTFYTDGGGLPGAVLWSGFAPGNLGETFLRIDNVGNPTFLYGATLGTPFAATAGTKYWMSVVPNLGFPPEWLWETGTGGDGEAYDCFQGGCGTIPNDLSFQLFGTVQLSGVPEPNSLILLGTGALGLAGVIRSKLFSRRYSSKRASLRAR